MKVLATSDLHGNLPEVPECDLLIIAGDVCPDFRPYGNRGRDVFSSGIDTGGTQQSQWLATEFAPWLDEIPAKDVIGIAGNHDYVFERPFLIPKDLRWTYLRDEAVNIEGLTIYGTPWVPNLPRWAFYGSPQALEARASIIPSGLDVLVTHGPPHLHGDFVPWNKYGTPPEGEHVGDAALNAAILRAKPRAVVCGHIHEAYGHHPMRHSELGVFNVALVNEFYDPVNPIVELPL